MALRVRRKQGLTTMRPSPSNHPYVPRRCAESILHIIIDSLDHLLGSSSGRSSASHRCRTQKEERSSRTAKNVLTCISSPTRSPCLQCCLGRTGTFFSRGQHHGPRL